ncbi:hypothetical protein A8F95_18740 [Bacillus wudalianchiensis]|uniref:Spore germination protein n=1 Tax=Pseudobacillus wudalianchiensis TaxID=1743143 RepID=A0A1B9B7B6_9BACI|nr:MULTISPECIES: hypothetical protein [Bacillus]KMY53888.1 hypothetical protein AC623_07815 [Bacillus sp. FJAT-27231]OCA91949.1 hypothetical protein A8F95_18740 [Bacillus wudalianchiensis]
MFAPVVINVLGIKVNAIDHGTVLNLGSSQHIDLFVSYKRNQGIGEQNGDLSPTVLSQSAVWDMDAIDSPSAKSSFF